MNDLLTTRQLSEHIPLGESSLRSLARRGLIPSYRSPGGRKRAFDLEQVKAAKGRQGRQGPEGQQGRQGQKGRNREECGNMNIENRVCKNCGYWEDLDLMYPDSAALAPPEAAGRGRCHRYPPRIRTDSSPALVVYPYTLPADYCGEWMGKDGRDGTEGEDEEEVSLTDRLLAATFAGDRKRVEELSQELCEDCYIPPFLLGGGEENGCGSSIPYGTPVKGVPNGVPRGRNGGKSVSIRAVASVVGDTGIEPVTPGMWGRWDTGNYSK